KNFNIVESLKVEFGEGFHVLSGETGAGKSILLTALAFALGAKADAETIRAGAQEATVTLALEIPAASPFAAFAEELGLALPEDGIFYLKRSLNISGRSRALINDEPVTLKTLQAWGERLVHLVRQHAAHRLLEEPFLLGLLDRFGAYETVLQAYREAFQRQRESEREWAALSERVAKTRQQEEFLRFQCEELNKAALKPGEEEELEGAKSRLKHRVALAEQSYELRQLLIEADDSISNRLGKALHLAEKGRALDETLAPLAQHLEEAIGAIQNAERVVSDYGQSLEEEPADLDGLESRLALIAGLKRKYHQDEAGLLELAERLNQDLSELENFDRLLEETAKKRDEVGRQLKDAAQALGAKRRAAAKRLSAKLLEALKDLALPHARLEFQLSKIEELADFRADGGDRLSLQVSFNPGEEPRPFEEIVSGGELSRLLLAFYEIVFPAEEVGTFVFDEVDAGVGGKVAELIGRKLEALARKAQVLCVTHLPQIACHADHHYRVEKSVREGRTYSEILSLKGEERAREIARMLAGVEITPQALKHAKELLKNAAA
ncbi:MAG TPA: DNA repair protein RecN, partial [bacterium]|nr:DNA repair protein RecN [bacterium]